jgi:hypothetical protein
MGTQPDVGTMGAVSKIIPYALASKLYAHIKHPISVGTVRRRYDQGLNACRDRLQSASF